MAKKPPPVLLRHLMAWGFGGLRAKQPNVQGIVATRYETMKMSCHWWSSVDVTYVQPPQDSVRKRPTPATHAGKEDFVLNLVMKYQSATSANLGPVQKVNITTQINRYFR
jgi:hypothetical protein